MTEERKKEKKKRVKNSMLAEKTANIKRSGPQIQMPCSHPLCTKVIHREPPGFSAIMKPNNTLRRLLVHPKEKRDTLATTDAVYEVSSHNCNA